MRRLLLACALALVLPVLSAAAEEPATEEAPPWVPEPTTVGADIRIDEDAGVVSIVIDEREVVRIDSEGMHVSGNLSYDGAITDTNGSVERTPHEADSR